MTDTDTHIHVHATAITIGNTGLLFMGPSGIGKSMIAFNCMVCARRSGLSAALIADDQVILSRSHAGLIGTCPKSIAGLMEIRGSGIARLPYVASAPLHLAIQLVETGTADRLPPEKETYEIASFGSLPLLRLVREVREPLAVISTFYPDIGLPKPF